MRDGERVMVKTTESGQTIMPLQRMKTKCLVDLSSVRDTSERGTGCTGNRHLSYSAKSISVNVGGSSRNANGSCPQMFWMSVRTLIVVSVRESRIQGEGG